MANFLLNLPRYPNIFNTRSAAWMLALQYSRFSSVAPMARSRQLRTKRKPPHMRIWAKRIFRWKSWRVSPAAKRHHWGFGWIPISNYLKPTVDGRKSAPPVWNHANNGIFNVSTGAGFLSCTGSMQVRPISLKVNMHSYFVRNVCITIFQLDHHIEWRTHKKWWVMICYDHSVSLRTHFGILEVPPCIWNATVAAKIWIPF